jgi:hypothetical protein
VQQPVFRKAEGVDLDLGLLPGADKADSVVRHHRLDLEPAFERHHFEQCLGRGDEAARGVDCELLHGLVRPAPSAGSYLRQRPRTRGASSSTPATPGPDGKAEQKTARQESFRAGAEQGRRHRRECRPNSWVFRISSRRCSGVYIT